MSSDMRQCFQFGPWKVEPLRGAVTGPDGKARHLEPKVMEVLVCLAQHANELVTRDQLLDAVWRGQDVTDEPLTRAIGELRRALHDSRGDPKFVETIPKRGYRLIGQIHLPEEVKAKGKLAPAESNTGRAGGKLAFIIGVVLMLGFVLTVLERIPIQPVDIEADVELKDASVSVRPRPLTTMEGFELQPALSPNGSHIAFLSLKNRRDIHGDIYVMPLSGDAPMQLNAADRPAVTPIWSPDGSRVAYASFNVDEEYYDIIVRPLVGGSPTLLASKLKEVHGLDWSANGRFVAFSALDNSGERLRVFLLSLDSGEVEQVTEPDRSFLDDVNPIFSPDGNMLAYQQYWFDKSLLCVQSLAESKSKCLTDLNTLYPIDYDWSPDSRGLIFIEGHDADTRQLMRVPTGGGNPIWLQTATGAEGLSIAKNSNVLVYSQAFQELNLWRMPGPLGVELGQPKRLISSTRDDLQAEYSPNGREIAFISSRTGNYEVWVGDANGSSSPRQLTRLGHAIFPRWSPDGSQILFHSCSRRNGFFDGYCDAYVIDAKGGFAKNLTDDNFHDLMPNWSLDGRSIYFHRTSECGFEIWKKSVGDGLETRLTTCAMTPQEGRNGRIYFITNTDSWAMRSLNSMRVDGSDIRIELSSVNFGFAAWKLWQNKLISIDRTSNMIVLLDLDSGDSQPLTAAYPDEKTPMSVHEKNVAISPDGRWITYTQLDRAGSDLIIVDNIQKLLADPMN